MGIKFNILPLEFATRLAVQILSLGGIAIKSIPPPLPALDINSILFYYPLVLLSFKR
jgi:hypothetical protein